MLPHRGRPSAHTPGGGGPLVVAGHARRRSRAAAAAAPDVRHGLPRPQHQRLPRPSRPRLHRLHRRRRRHPRHLGSGAPAAGQPLELPAAVSRLLPHRAAGSSSGLLAVSDESIADGGKDWPKLVWIVDVREETKPVPISTCPLPPLKAFTKRGGRFGAHNLHENRPAPGTWTSETVVVGTFFNGGVRAFDISDAFRPQEVAWAVPPSPRKSRAKAIQLNDVFVDDRAVLYTVDRLIGGLYIYELRL